MTSLVAAEWLKLRTTRLLLGILTSSVVISSAAVAGVVLSGDAVGLESPRGIERVFSVTGAGAVLVLVAGIVISSGEYRHGTAIDTFLTTPQRHRVIEAKLVAGAGIGLVIGAITATASVVVANALYPFENATFPTRSFDVWLALLGTIVYTTLFAVLGVALGALIRNQVLAVAGALAWLGVVEHTLVNLAPAVGRWLPAGAGQAIVRTPIDGLLSPIAGATVLAAYVAAIAVVGIRTEAVRDV